MTIPYLLDGIANGCIYGLFGLALVVIYRTNHLFNFAQTTIVCLIMVLTVMLQSKVDAILPVTALAVVGSFIFGMLLHIVIMRSLSERKGTTKANETMITIGIYAVFDSVSAFIYGDNPSSFPSPFGSSTVELGGLSLSAHSIGIVFVTCLIAVAIYLFFKFSKLGILMEAVAEDITVARLRGIRASNILAMAWGLTTTLGVVAGLLIAPVVFVSPQMLDSIFIYSMIAVVIGGLESPFGALLGGIMVGVIENITSSTELFGSQLKMSGVFVLLIVILIVRPTGIWGRPDSRRV